MKTRTKAGLGYFTIAALVTGAMAFSAPPAAAGNAYGRDDNPGKAMGHAEGGPAGANNGNGNLASAMGSLNAAHASPNGLKNANRENSRVGMLAAYMDAMVVYEDAYNNLTDDELADYEAALAVLADPLATEAEKAAAQTTVDTIGADLNVAAGDAARHLKNAANKDGLIDADVVHEVNNLLDGKSDDFTHSGIEGSEQSIADIINPPE